MAWPKRVIIVGAGFGGLEAAKTLPRSGVDITLIDRTNHHLFQPLLYQVATARLAPSGIAASTRALVRRRNVRVVMATVTGVDTDAREVKSSDGQSYGYDYLILATGADYSFFGRDEWAATAPVIKSLEDALHVWERILRSLEAAEAESDCARRHSLLTFAVVGGGPTGVEMATAILDLARLSVRRFRHVSPRDIRVLLLEAGPTILGHFGADLSAHACATLKRQGVELMLNSPVAEIGPEGLRADGVWISTPNVIWCAGTQARPAGTWIDAPVARNGGIEVRSDCGVPGHAVIFAVGDGASFRTEDGRVLPGLAPVAKQQGRYVARLIARRIGGRPPPGPFRYRNWGSMAVTGRRSAVADLGLLKLRGYLAWLLWSLVHLWLLGGMRNRASVALNWGWGLFSRHPAAPLVTGSADNRQTVHPQSNIT
ncbi:NAD(P)/FAD-dependent oxidoreductase [Paracoccus benzoatiresistens]|uniref:NADH:ubiquinone reductase (non-electrogenic) n=1 Tax=Paracoccus benzoatiresistens TaxID=2997341 RepID=A0ABT4JBK2_9RHOB|nr:NAD(P)/FAD-dependent oxidoreductase [Paracoccus sp. EF6]MCZ0964507.1 NAD(P)/FAD-dependent oxidoreductase [Paracoccus sp. EF6]